jgi:hypothetical protein
MDPADQKAVAAVNQALRAAPLSSGWITAMSRIEERLGRLDELERLMEHGELGYVQDED